MLAPWYVRGHIQLLILLRCLLPVQLLFMCDGIKTPVCVKTLCVCRQLDPQLMSDSALKPTVAAN